MNYQTFGSFLIPLDSYGNISANLSKFWEQVEATKAGLSRAKGCYIFGIRTSGTAAIMPWYVGKTNRSFEAECFQPHKMNHYSRSLSRYRRAKPFMFLVARLTKGGALYRGNGPAATKFFENHLITLSLRANTDLANKKDTKMLREVKLRGILNSDGFRMDPSASELQKALRVNSRQIKS